MAKVVLQNRGIWDDADGYEIIEIHQYLPRWDGGSYFYCDVRNTRTGDVFENTMYCTVTTYVEAIADCQYEFGRDHGDDHSDCGWMIEQMSEGYPDETDYSGWYDYDAGLRWSDFVEGVIE